LRHDRDWRRGLERCACAIGNDGIVTTRWASRADYCTIVAGKTRDSNSNFLAKMLFDLAIDLKRIEVIADDEDEIVEAVTRMHKNYDLVITSGGIGPTHDDIT
jgi:molybdenum cofactor synthesis domain-containing protein